VKRIRRAACAAVVFAFERPVLQRRDQLRTVLVEGEGERAVLEGAGGRRHLLVAVEERALDGRAVAGDLEAERNLEPVDDNGRVPQARERLRGGACRQREHGG